MNAHTRKAVGCLVLLVYLTVYAPLAATLGAYIWPRAPSWVGLIYYAVAGVVWVFPLRPLFNWMNRA